MKDYNYFNLERFFDRLYVLAPLIFALIFIICDYIFFSRSMISILILSIAGGVCSTVLIIKYIACPRIIVNDTDEIFYINDSAFNFTDLEPESKIYISANTKFMYWYRFTLYFKDGVIKEFTLPVNVGNCFMNKYLKKYSKPVIKHNYAGIKF